MNANLPIIATVTLAIGLMLSACGINIIQGSGRIESETRQVSDFTAVNFPDVGELTIIQGEAEELTVETDDNLLPYIKSTVSGGTLTIGFDDSRGRPLVRQTKSIRYTLTVKTLTALELSGAGTVYAAKLATDDLTLVESGAGKITIDQLDGNRVSVTMSGAGTVDLAGQVTGQTVEMSGFGSYEASDLQSEDATVTLSGAGSATIWATEHLDANLTGAGSIRYYGSPQANTSMSGIGSVQRIGDK